MTDFAADWNSVPAGDKPSGGRFMTAADDASARRLLADAESKGIPRTITVENNALTPAELTAANERPAAEPQNPGKVPTNYLSDWNAVGAPESKAEPVKRSAPVAEPAAQEAPAKTVDREVVHAIASGIGHQISGGLAGLTELIKTGGDIKAATKVIREHQEAGYQAKGEPAQKVMGAIGSDYNPLNWIPNAAKAVAEKGAEKGILKPSEAAAIETAGTAVAPGMLLKGMKGAQFFKRVEPPKPRLTHAEALEQMKAPQTPEAVHFNNVKNARANGLVVTPRQASPNSTTANLYEGVSGSAKMEKLASIKNSPTINKIIATEDLGIKPNERISDKLLESIREKEGAAYQAVKDSGVTLKTNEAYETAVKGLAGDVKDALPGVIKTAEIDDLIRSLSVGEMSPKTAITTVKVLRANGTKNIKAGYQSPEKEALGFAQRKAADAIDGLIESNLSDAGKKGLSDAYKASRIKIAKTHDIEAALNDATGNIDAHVFAKMLDKGKPLSGGTLKVAKFAKAFPGAARNVDTMKDATNFSAADLVAGVVGGSLTTGGALAVGARPAARSIALSKIGQRVVAR